MNLHFFGTRVLPVVAIVGAVHLTIVNTLFPMSDEQRQELEERRNLGRLSRFQKPDPVPRKVESEAFREEAQSDGWPQGSSDEREKSYGIPTAGEGDGSNVHR